MTLILTAPLDNGHASEATTCQESKISEAFWEASNILTKASFIPASLLFMLPGLLSNPLFQQAFNFLHKVAYQSICGIKSFGDKENARY